MIWVFGILLVVLFDCVVVRFGWMWLVALLFLLVESYLLLVGLIVLLFVVLFA